MAHDRSRRPQASVIKQFQTLSVLRESHAYQNGDPEAIEAAARLEFGGQIALQHYSGNRNTPRAVQHRLHLAALAQIDFLPATAYNEE